MAVCTKIQDLLSPYLDGVLTAEENSMIERHLKNCISCRQELLLLKETVQIMHSLPDVAIPKDFSSRLHDKLALVAQESESKAPVPQKSWAHRIVHSPWFPLTAAAVLIFAIVTVINPSAVKTPMSDLSTQSENRSLVMDSGSSNEIMSDTIAMLGTDNENSQKEMAKDTNQVAEQADNEAETKEASSKDVDTSAEAVQKMPVESVSKEKTGAGYQTARAGDHKGDQHKTSGASKDTSEEVPGINSIEEAVPPEGEGQRGYGEDAPRMFKMSKASSEVTEEEIFINTAGFDLNVKEASTEEVFEAISRSYQVRTLDEKKGVITFKVPQEEMEKTISMLKGFGEIEQTSISNHDLSADYNETQNNLNEYLKFREELSALINASQDIEEKVRLEVKLHDLNSEIKLLEERILYYEEMSGSTLVEVTLRTVTSE